MKTFAQLLEIDGIVGELYENNPTLKDTKFGYAYKRFYEKNTEPMTKEFRSALQDARIDFALEDEKTKAIITDDKSPRGFAYSKEGLKGIIKEEAKIVEEFNKKEIEIEPHISTVVPEMNEYQKELLTGIII